MSFSFLPIIYPRWKLFNDSDTQSPHLTFAYSPAFQTLLLDFCLHEPAVLTPEQFRAIPYRRPLPEPQVLYASHLYDFCHTLI